jgi:formylglycine-generating enzyme required for sulfatase activity
MVILARLARAALVIAGGFVGPAAAQQCCIADVSTYCTAGTTVHGCVPSISGVGIPSAVDPGGFDIVISNVPGQRFGTIFYGFYQHVTPWAPGSFSFKCIANPTARTGDMSSGGTAGQCNGELRLDFNAWRAAHPTGLGSPFVAGQSFNAQGWFRDPGAPKQTNLSNALRFVLGPTCWAKPPGMVPISAGTFMMGSDAPSGHPYYNESDSLPVHQVTISRCFWMGETEVTQAQYAALMGTNPSFFSGAANPVERVSWFDALAYCAALTAQQSALGNVPSGYHYRLPTTAEWEYACRAGTTTEFNVGDELTCSHAKIGYSYHSNSWCPPQTSWPVGTFAPPNAWALYDMHGNVAEWCLDSIAAYSAGPITDPFATGGPDRVFRGGSLAANSSDCRSGDPDGGPPSVTTIALGFRVVLAPILAP